MENKIIAIAKYLEVETSEIFQLNEDYTTFEAEGKEYLVLTESESDEHVKKSIKKSLWAFNPSFLSDVTGLDIIIFEALAEQYENANEVILKLVELTCGIDALVDMAIKYDGYGHFLSDYDGEEIELDNNLFMYRVN